MNRLPDCRCPLALYACCLLTALHLQLVLDKRGEEEIGLVGLVGWPLHKTLGRAGGMRGLCDSKIATPAMPQVVVLVVSHHQLEPAALLCRKARPTSGSNAAAGLSRSAN